MCELDQLHEMGGINRRQFTTLGAFAAFAAACAPTSGSAADDQGLAEEMVKFPAPGGTMDAFFVHPAKGKHPAVIVWPDIAGLRDVKMTNNEPLRIDGTAGYETRIEGVTGKDNTPVRVVQWLRFGSGSATLRIVASAPQAGWSDAFTRFRAVRDSISAK